QHLGPLGGELPLNVRPYDLEVLSASVGFVGDHRGWLACRSRCSTVSRSDVYSIEPASGAAGTIVTIIGFGLSTGDGMPDCWAQPVRQYLGEQRGLPLFFLCEFVNRQKEPRNERARLRILVCSAWLSTLRTTSGSFQGTSCWHDWRYSLDGE